MYVDECQISRNDIPRCSEIQLTDPIAFLLWWVYPGGKAYFASFGMAASPRDPLRFPLALRVTGHHLLKRPVDQFQRIQATADSLDCLKCTGFCRVLPRDVSPRLHFPSIWCTHSRMWSYHGSPQDGQSAGQVAERAFYPDLERVQKTGQRALLNQKMHASHFRSLRGRVPFK